MKILRNKFLVGVLCILVGLLVGFVAIPALQQREQSETIRAVRMKVPVQAGSQITNDMLETVSIPAKLISGSIADPASVVGQYAATDLYAGDYLTAAKTTATLPDEVSFSAGMPADKRVVSITLPSLASGVSGHLLPGDIVSIIVVPKDVNQSLGLEPDTTPAVEPAGAVIYPELMNLEVCMVTTSDGSDARVAAHPDDQEKNLLPATVSFYVTDTQALKLAELEQRGVVHLAFVARGEATKQYKTNQIIVGSEEK